MSHECVCPVCGGGLPAMPLTILPERGMVVANGAFVSMPPSEMTVLEALVERWPNVVTKEAIMECLYLLEQDEAFIKIIDVYVCKIRKKIKPLGIEIQTHWGRGYSLGMCAQKPVVARASA